jgi:hypothetical protein
MTIMRPFNLSMSGLFAAGLSTMLTLAAEP